ncbi:P-loop containing nucleoside triphosphate hydrolase protein [Thermothelomyces heterothallicus CBS 202.75]|uniref:P-loop containing nucleoside triphosphate hydrolase protein n=1 Tax=Thermothelomyces heterothallicus CBS 202.75 TaxID=1149848 RepID=UPI003742F14A
MATPKRISPATLPANITRQIRRQFSSSPSQGFPSKHYPPSSKTNPQKKRATLAEPRFPAISYLPPPSNDPQQHVVPSQLPSAASLQQASTVFTSQAPRFLYSASRFLHIPVNTHTPEVCLVGRSNVGKSTLINALAGADADTARKAHGLKARSAGLAITSRVAGSTKSVNAYGFGPPSKAQRIAALERAREVKERLRIESGSRSERRAKRDLLEPLPQHRLVMVDLPGYGLGSEAEWGAEIQKYLARRQMLKGAVLLIDAVAGVKEADRMVLETLRDAEVRTSVVLTKVDKLMRDTKEERARSRVEEVCRSVWNELRRVEAGSTTWLEGAEKGWQREIWVTSAGDPDADGNGVGIVGARWEICRLAGLVEDKRVLNPPPKPAAQKIVSFDQIQWMADSEANRARILPQRPSF